MVLIVSKEVRIGRVAMAQSCLELAAATANVIGQLATFPWVHRSAFFTRSAGSRNKKSLEIPPRGCVIRRAMLGAR